MRHAKCEGLNDVPLHSESFGLPSPASAALATKFPGAIGHPRGVIRHDSCGSLADGRVEAMMEIVVVLQDATAKLASEHRLSWIVAKLSECGRCDHDDQSSSRRLDSQALSALTHRELA